MHSITDKLAHKLGDAELAAALVAAGFDSPAKIRAAKDADLDKAVGKARRQQLRAKVKPHKK